MKSYIRVEFGEVAVTFEGSEEFMSQSLHRLVSEIGPLVSGLSAAVPRAADPSAAAGGSEIALPELITRQSDKTQVRRFLAAAAWLQARQAQNLTSGSVGRALQDAKQPGVGNASDCLNQNIKRGFCERRKDKTFFVTPTGLKAVGLDGFV